MHANLLYAHTLKRTHARVHKLARNMTRTHRRARAPASNWRRQRQRETQREKLETDALTPVGGHTRVHTAGRDEGAALEVTARQWRAASGRCRGFCEGGGRAAVTAAGVICTAVRGRENSPLAAPQEKLRRKNLRALSHDSRAVLPRPCMTTLATTAALPGNSTHSPNPPTTSASQPPPKGFPGALLRVDSPTHVLHSARKVVPVPFHLKSFLGPAWRLFINIAKYM